MQTDSNSSSHLDFHQNYPLAGKFFIPRSQRQRFFIQFTFMTFVGWVVGGIASLALEKTLNSWNLPVGNTFISYLSSIVFAVIFAADQALVLRLYLSGWLWILATSVGWLIANGVATAWIKYFVVVAASLNVTSSPDAIVILGFLSTISYILSGIWLGLCQWLVLRRYTAGAWWWNFIPAASFFFISLLIWLLSLLQDFLPLAYRSTILSWSGQGFTAVILGVIPAISLCTLKKKLHYKNEISG
ncbi:hypothetical protein [Calothrix sp. PCC 7507]|uniref:hypothetical protein n=1 Tax=Calothrix sp. PCC 7507 TaxID=99598 RepID=UPI00029EF23E|nr:hypothetical protein [Calothrix sp. PCC 7507]AFY34861.1 hypothetical protein Cal7507_4492 [Calothrix sp. PCC 7507]